MYLLFADDLIFFSQSAIGLQKQLNCFYLYCKLWHLIVSLPKTNVVIYNPLAAKANCSFTYGDQNIKIIEKYKYLGLWCSNNKNMFASNYEYLADKVSKSIFAIRHYSSASVGKLPPKISLKTLNVQILPILMYCSELMYNGKETKAIEQVQLKYHKLMLGVSRHTSSPGVYGETGQFPIFILQKIMTLKYWCHILNSSSRSPLRHCYKSLIHFDRSGKVNWVTHVKQLLCSIGLQDTWREKRIENSKRFMKDIEITIKNDYINIWRQATTSAPKLRTWGRLPSYLRDSGHLLNLLKDHDIPHNSRIISLDVCSLYTNIPHEDGLQAIMDVGTEFDPLTDYTPVRDIASLVLKNNIFKFDGRHYIQTQGTAMGTRMAPAYANIFMHPIEKNILANHPNITFWRRYIDDIICIMETDDAHTVDDLLAYANQLHRTIKFTMEADTKGIPFLDMILTIKNRRINSQPYTKPTDRKLYIRKDSCHPTHQKTGIAYSQALRLKRICSSTTDYISETDTLKTNLIRRGYDENMIQKQIDKATAITREDLLKNSTTNRPDADEAIHFITTYRHGLQNTHNIIKSMCDKFNVEIVFRIAYRRDQNIKDILVRAKLPDATERTPITTQLTSRYVNNTNSHIYCRKDVDDRTCVRCHMLALDRKFILHRGSVHVINKQITSCKQLHNIYIIRCLICDTWDQHTELITPHDLINNLRTRGFSISPEEHPHPRSSSDIMLYPVWSYHTATVRCTECKFCISTNITRMPTTIEQEIKASVTSIKLGIFSKDFAYTSCQRQTCQVCTRVENGLLQCRSGANYRTRPVLCHTTGCVYALQCLWCSQVYIGQTGRELHTRIREHIRNIKISCTTSNFATHMNSHNAPLNFKIFVLNYVNTKFDRLLQESSWINQTKAEINNTIEGHYTLSPTCLQVYNHYQHSATCQPIFKALPR